MNTQLQSKKILIAPLDWGLGHATRCISIIHYLLKNNCDITIATCGKQKKLLQKEFPELNFLDLPGYNITYSKTKRGLAFKVLIQMPKILKIIWLEHTWLKKLIRKNNFSAILSDNRFGFYSKKTTSVFITHQLLIKTKFLWLEKILQYFNYKFINQFTECWVPDFEKLPDLAGKLSHPEKLPRIPVKYLGLLSRFSKKEGTPIQHKWMVIISGPEPQRTIFENKILEVAKQSTDNFFIARGLPGVEKTEINLPNCRVFNHLTTAEMQAAILASEYIVSRCGYTTVMEILSLQKKTVLVPTPGQTEQEYLAQHLTKQNWCYAFDQQENFAAQFLKAETFFYNLPNFSSELYKQTLNQFISCLK